MSSLGRHSQLYTEGRGQGTSNGSRAFSVSHLCCLSDTGMGFPSLPLSHTSGVTPSLSTAKMRVREGASGSSHCYELW